jgi:hypothetical protein
MQNTFSILIFKLLIPFICGLFNDAVSSLDYIAYNAKLIERILKEKPWSNLWYYPGICQERLRKAMKKPTVSKAAQYHTLCPNSLASSQRHLLGWSRSKCSLPVVVRQLITLKWDKSQRSKR